jgi:hypothetical protein
MHNIVTATCYVEVSFSRYVGHATVGHCADGHFWWWKYFCQLIQGPKILYDDSYFKNICTSAMLLSLIVGN